MYDGIGLHTPQATGTNGYIQTNKFFIKPKTNKVVETTRDFDPDQGIAGITRKPNKDILEHDRKRQIQLKLVTLEDKLSEQGFMDDEIAEKLLKTKTALETAAAAAADELSEQPLAPTSNKISDMQTHQVAARKEKQLETFRAALWIASPGQEELVDPTADGLVPGSRKNDDGKMLEKREHSFLDRDVSRKKKAVEDDKECVDDQGKDTKDAKSKKDGNRNSIHQKDRRERAKDGAYDRDRLLQKNDKEHQHGSRARGEERVNSSNERERKSEYYKRGRAKYDDSFSGDRKFRSDDRDRDGRARQ